LLASHGDSISRDQGYSNYLYQLHPLTGKRADIRPRGTNGISWNYDWPDDPGTDTMITEAPASVDTLITAGITNWLIAFGGTNGIVLGGHDAATEYADFEDYLADRLAAGWVADNIVVCTMLPRTGLDEGVRSDYNTALVSGATTHGYRLARLDLDPDIGAAGHDLNTDWFYDGTHPTVAGHTRIAQIIRAAMVA
jgi:hypothetical protein